MVEMVFLPPFQARPESEIQICPENGTEKATTGDVNGL